MDGLEVDRGRRPTDEAPLVLNARGPEPGALAVAELLRAHELGTGRVLRPRAVRGQPHAVGDVRPQVQDPLVARPPAELPPLDLLPAGVALRVGALVDEDGAVRGDARGRDAARGRLERLARRP